MKRSIQWLGLSLLLSLGLVACAPNDTTETPDSQTPTTETPDSPKIKVGMVTDTGTIDDKSFNQGTWEGIVRYTKEHDGVVEQYVKPGGETKEDYLNAIDNLVLAGNSIIVAPGFKFEEAIGTAQETYPEVQFILIDGQPIVGVDEDENSLYEVASNTVSVFFSEQEASFLAGVSAALESKTGKLGFIGGMEVPAVQKLGWGFLAGVAYANDVYGSKAEVVDYVYQGTFTDVAAGTALAGGMYDKGVDIIFAAGGGVGVGVINEAKTRVDAGESVYVVGVDIDQYSEGLLTDGTSVILTSAMKRLDVAAYDLIDQAINGTFPGGETLTFDATSNGVGLPLENPNLSANFVAVREDARRLIETKELNIPDTKEGTTDFVATYSLDISNLTY